MWDFPFSIPLRFYQSLYFCSTTQQTFAGLEDVLKASLRRLQRNNFLPSMTSWRRLAKMSWRRLEDVLEKEKLLRWRCLQDVSKTCLQDVLKICLEDMSSGRPEDMSSRHIFRTSWRHVFETSWRHLQRNNFSFSKTSSRRLQDIFARRLQDVMEGKKLLRWRRLKDAFKTSSRPANVCWVVEQKYKLW